MGETDVRIELRVVETKDIDFGDKSDDDDDDYHHHHHHNEAIM